MVGLPFANLGSVELKERMSYVTTLENGSGRAPAKGKDAGTALYENLCMRSVNQSIGESVVSAEKTHSQTDTCMDRASHPTSGRLCSATVGRCKICYRAHL